MALGIGRGDEVITVPFTFVATGEMIALAGATPVFVDIDPRTWNLDPARLEAAITLRTRAIMPVSLFGQCADFAAINAIAARHRLPVIDDAAQSFGAIGRRRSCSLRHRIDRSFRKSPWRLWGWRGAFPTTTPCQVMPRSRPRQDRAITSAPGWNGPSHAAGWILLAKLEIFDEE